MADVGRVCTNLHARCGMPFDALMCVVLARPISGGRTSLPSHRRPATRCGASETSTGFANIVRFFIRASFSCRRRLIGDTDPTPNTTCPEPQAGTVAPCHAGRIITKWREAEEVRTLQLRRRTKPMVACWGLNPSAGHERRKQDSVPRARRPTKAARNRTSKANMLLRPSLHQRNNCRPQYDRHLAALAWSPGCSQLSGPRSRFHLSSPCLVLCNAVPRRFCNALATRAFSFGFSEFAKLN